MNDPARSTRLEISFNDQGKPVDRTMEILPQEDLARFLQRCILEVTEYFRFDWRNHYRLRGDSETDWLSERSMSNYLKERSRP